LCYNYFFYLIKRINIKNSIIFVILLIIFIMIKSINIKNSISCVIIIFIFIIIKSLEASTPNSKLVLEASRPTLQAGRGRVQTHLGVWALTPPDSRLTPSWVWTRSRPTTRGEQKNR